MFKWNFNVYGTKFKNDQSDFFLPAKTSSNSLRFVCSHAWSSSSSLWQCAVWIFLGKAYDKKKLNIDSTKRQWWNMTDVISVRQLERTGNVREGRMEKGSNQSEGIDLSSRSVALPASGNDLHYTGCTPTGAQGWRDFTLERSPIKLQDWVIKWLGQKPPQNSVLSPSKDERRKYESCIDCDVVVRIISSTWEFSFRVFMLF